MELERMTVSVVIATYNRSVMVREAVHAALAQSRPPDEVVVLDDASTDGTWEELGKLAWAYSRVHIYRRAANSGGVAAWNEAAGRAQSDAIAFCADDDRFLRAHLQASLDYLEQHPAVGLVHSSFIDAVEAGLTESFEPRPLRSPQPLETTHGNLLSYMTRYYNWPFHPSTLVLRREVWVRTGGLDPRYALADTDWFVRAVELFPAVLLPRHGVYNRRHPGNWSNRLGSARMQREIFLIVEALIQRLHGGNPLSRAGWRAVWRADVRLHLLLTLIARLKTGHADAACAVWHGMTQDTGRSFPRSLERAGESLIRACCQGREGQSSDPRESVSPL
jgi:glycosyltransferase involved in cell wall biosynthesis